MQTAEHFDPTNIETNMDGHMVQQLILGLTRGTSKKVQTDRLMHDQFHLIRRESKSTFKDDMYETSCIWLLHCSINSKLPIFVYLFIFKINWSR